MWLRNSSIAIVASLLSIVAIHGSTTSSPNPCTRKTETWEIRFNLDVPRVFDNSLSKGYRRYQAQTVRGYFTVEEIDGTEPKVSFFGFENITHKVGGKNVTYDVYEDFVMWHGIGSNKTGRFNTRSASFSLVLLPSYAIEEEATEDNSLYITVSGKGNTGYLSGYASGQIGCGCAEYGHVSPTRIWNTSAVVDTASVFGRWKAKRRNVSE